MIYAVPAAPVVTLPVAGSEETYPVRRIWCVGRNYAAHAREMGSDPDRDPPFFFAKPTDAIVQNGDPIPYPSGTKNLHHEIELVVAIGKAGSKISVEQALDHVYGYAVGLDMTRRDLQQLGKDHGRPWDFGKDFDEAAPCSALVPAAKIGHPDKGGISLLVNGKTRQNADLSEMIWSVPEQIAYLSEYYTLVPGDIIYSGTPAGVGPVKPGDELHATVEGVGELKVSIIEAP